MDDYPLEIEGAWIRICCRLYWSGGVATKTLEEWSRILREKPRKTLRIFDFFLAKNICDLVNQNGSITITSRRIVRDEHIRNIRRLSGSMGGNPILKKTENEENLVNQTVNQKPTPSSSSSSSTSSSIKNKRQKIKDIVPKILFGHFVKLTQKEYDQFIIEWGVDKLTDAIMKLDYSINTGKKYADHNMTLRNWDRRGYLEGGSNGNGKREQGTVTHAASARFGDGNAYPIDIEVNE